MKIRDISSVLESLAPLSLQEDYDNSGLIVGDPLAEISKTLICLDVTEEVVEEAIENNCELIIAHHPIVFRGLKKLNGKNYVERVVIKAIQNNIAIYAIHTNLDNVLKGGVNSKIANKLGLTNTSVLRKRESDLCKLVTFSPKSHTSQIRKALHDAGAGAIGKYDNCSFVSEGMGSFRGGEDANSFVGTNGEIHRENEDRIEVILPKWTLPTAISKLKNEHPYEEVAYDVYPLLNTSQETGAGLLGMLTRPMTQNEFLQHLKESMKTSVIKYTSLSSNSIQKVAVCGGSGSFLIGDAKRIGADAYVTGDIKYHEFFDGENELMICDIGHYESEQFTIELLGDFLLEKIPNFALVLTRAVTNPINYFH